MMTFPNGVSAWLLRPTGARTAIDGPDDPTARERGIVWIDCEEVTSLEEAAETFASMDLADLDQGFLGHLFEGINPGPDYPTPTLWPDPDSSKRLAAPQGVRLLNAYWAHPEIGLGVDETPVMLLSMVSFLVGRDWLITNRRPGYGFAFGSPQRSDPVSREQLSKEMEDRWGEGFPTRAMSRCSCCAPWPAAMGPCLPRSSGGFRTLN
jgi:hypothetical protein